MLVVLPVKGIASELPELAANLEPVLEQDYPRYRAVFAVGDPNDLAVPALADLCARYPKASLVVADPQPGRSQKIGNQLRALQTAEPGDEILVFLDSDARPAEDLLRRLVAPLSDPGVGATTGYRCYVPAPDAPAASWVRAAWNTAGIPFMSDPSYAYAWGGAMAVRRDVFEDCRVAKYWETALSDDLGLSHVLRRRGYRIELLTDCAVCSPEDLPDWPSVWEWTRRQTLICKVYHFAMWRDLFVGEGITLLLALGAIAMAVWERSAAASALAATTLAILFGGIWLYQVLAVRGVRHASPTDISPEAARRLSSPLMALRVNLLTLAVSLASAISNTLTWRGIKYRLKGPQQIEVFQSTTTSKRLRKAAARPGDVVVQPRSPVPVAARAASTRPIRVADNKRQAPVDAESNPTRTAEYC